MASAKLYGTDLSTYTFTMSATEDASYPLANLSDYLTTTLWKSSVTTNGQTLKIDFGASNISERDFCVLDGINFKDMDVSLQAADDSGFSSGLVTVATVSGGLGSGPFIFTFAGVTKRYWRLLFTDAFSLYPQVGNFFIDKAFDWTEPYDVPYRNANLSFESEVTPALDGTLRSVQPYSGRKSWRFSLQKPGLSDTVRTNFQTFFNKVRGKHRPFYFLDVDGTTKALVRFDIDVDPSEVQAYNLNLFSEIVLVGQQTS